MPIDGIHKMCNDFVPECLFHWSESEVGVFLDTSTFKTQTQGRVYAVQRFNDLRKTTKTIKARSLLIFTGEALDLFVRHPRVHPHGFKSCYGQMWSIRFGDLAWDQADATRHGRVLVIRKARIVQIDEIWRKRRQMNRVILSWLFLLALFPISVLLLYLFWAHARMIGVCLLIFALLDFVAIWICTRKRLISFEEGWNPATDIESAGFR